MQAIPFQHGWSQPLLALHALPSRVDVHKLAWLETAYSFGTPNRPWLEQTSMNCTQWLKCQHLPQLDPILHGPVAPNNQGHFGPSGQNPLQKHKQKKTAPAGCLALHFKMVVDPGCANRSCGIQQVNRTCNGHRACLLHRDNSKARQQLCPSTIENTPSNLKSGSLSHRYS